MSLKRKAYETECEALAAMCAGSAPKKSNKKVRVLLSAPKEIEKKLLAEGFKYLIGTDETGVGSLAGPICVCATHVPIEVTHGGVRDSKSLTPANREQVWSALDGDARVKKQIVFLDHEYVDQHNNLRTRLDGMTKAVEQLIVADKVLERFKLEDIVVLIDGNMGPKELTSKYECRLIVKGDVNSYAIGAASIFAKVVRDRYMADVLHPLFPKYDWVNNKGYPSDQGKHMRMVTSIGNSPFHRLTFNPCKTVKLSVHAVDWLSKHKTTDPEFRYEGYETTV